MDSRVRDSWQAWNEPFEGSVLTFYNDIKGLTTIGVGDLCNTIDEAQALEMVRTSDGAPATAAEITADWRRVHDNPTFAKLGWTAAAKGATVRLTPGGLTRLVLGKLDQMAGYLAHRFPEWEQWPWQAQQAALSMSWAAGPALHAPHWEMACRTQDWALAAKECHLEDSQNPGLRPRNAANRALYEQAVADTQSPPDDGPAANETEPSDTLEGTQCH